VREKELTVCLLTKEPSFSASKKTKNNKIVMENMVGIMFFKNLKLIILNYFNVVLKIIFLKIKNIILKYF